MIQRSIQWLAAVAFIATALAVTVPVHAASVHFKPPHSVPDFTDLGLQLNAVGALAGLGNADVVVHLDATADATATCTNPAGANKPPGQNPAPVTVSGVQIIPASLIKNGNVAFSVTTVAPVTPIPGAPGCPNVLWTESITDLLFTTADVTFSQLGNVELSASCVFSPATKDGPVDAMTVTCTVE